MTPIKRTRLYVGLLLVASGVGAVLLGLRAERFVENRHAELMESHVHRRADLVRMAEEAHDDTGRRRLAHHDEVVAPQAQERYEFAQRISKTTVNGGLGIAAAGLGLVVIYLRARLRYARKLRATRR